MLHLPDFLCFLFDTSASRVACSKTSRTPSPVLAEHSRYRVAPIFWRTISPCVAHVRSVTRLVTVEESHAHLLARDGPLTGPPQFVDSLGVVPQILLAPDEDDGQARAEVQDF